ncbi:MAG TPA: hypothetical protein VLB75_02270 [Steroidobacteraceae bacterium]|nr:hypothetical protein [Steroidobacteraceae bacterium]
MTPDDDQRWLEALAGRGRTDSPAAREAASLRGEILRTTSARAAPPVPAQDRVREMTLIARARGEGLLPAPKNPRWSWRWEWNASLAVAALAAVAIGIGLYLRASVEPQIVVRGTPDGIVRITAPDPAGLKQQLIEDLRAAGVNATGYELLGRQGVDADLPQPLPEAVRRVLDRHGIPPPADGVLRVEIEKASP